MKIAEVTYVGTMTSNKHRGPSGESYYFRAPRGQEPRPEVIDNVDDALHFDRMGSPYEVEWTGVGKVARSGKKPLKSLKKMGYRQKQALAKEFDIKANQSEDDLEDELRPVVEQLVEEEF